MFQVTSGQAKAIPTQAVVVIEQRQPCVSGHSRFHSMAILCDTLTLNADLLEAGMCSAYTALPDSASAAQYRPTWRRGPRPWGPAPARYAPLVVVVYCRV